MNLYLLQKMLLRKYPVTLVVLLLLLLLHENYAIDPMPLCQTCGVDDGFSCISCSACQTYAVLSSGNFLHYKGYCQCDTGYYLNQDDANNVYCDRCHTSCKKCYGSLASNCISCSDRFDFVQNGSFCQAPNNSSDQTLIQAYSFYGFSYQTGWSYATQTAGTYATLCGERSILGGIGVSSGNYPMTLTYTTPSIPYHFQLRVKMAFYIFNTGGSSAQAWLTVTPSTTVLNKTYSYGSTAINTCAGTNYIHFNIDDTFAHQATTATVQIGLSQNQWFGIRQFYLIAKKCKAQNCSLCTGYLATQCKQCVDVKRIANSPINPGTCLCDGVYYQQPYAGQCVDPCPSVPVQYYGDPTTRYCQTSCPSGYYALDDTYRCVTDCPVTSAKSGYLLFKDITNRKCVSTCPDTEPYAYPLAADRFCYATCPAGTFATDAKDRRCVATCPYNSTYKLYGYNGKCIATCPIGYWADPFTITCLTNCTSASYPFKDNSTGTGLCVSRCPAPSYFGYTGNYSCIQICPVGTYGQRFDATNVQLLQTCVAKCNSPRWGLVTDNRKCVEFCPQDYWGQPVNRLCTNLPSDCNPLYADNYTRTCMAPLQCSFGFYADNSTWRCVPYCPTGSYAHPVSKICQSQCDAPYFRDSGINACVQVCNTLGTYADVSSTRTCVPACNITGLTPWADESTRTCVSDCNNTVQNFLSDNTTWKCVYNCPINYFADWTTTAPKCLTSCPANYYADISTGTGVCVQTCPAYPRKFGDVVGGKNVCVDVCTSPTLFGDETGFRLCMPACPSLYFAQNDAERLCVLKCKSNTYGWNNVCLQDPKLCPSGYFGDDSTNLCVNLCPSSQKTFGDPVSKLCVKSCPLNPNYPTSGPAVYFADISNRLCVLTCNAAYLTGLYGNNNTRTCETKCLDRNSYAEPQTTNRLCVAVCLQSPVFNYANNDTKVCGTSISCQLNYFGQNTTQLCIQSCSLGSFAYKTNLIKLCIDKCPLDSASVDWYGDITTSKRVCVTQCPSLPLRFADPTNKLCVETCPLTYYGDLATRKCVTLCPSGYFAHQITRKCVSKCPDTYFGDDTPTVRYCHPNSALCGSRFGDPYLNLCVAICTGPTPFSYFGYGDNCVLTCPDGTYADSDTGTRLCVADCPDYTAIGGRDLYGDSLTHTCEPKCIKPLTWADYQTRDCQSPCSALPIPTYSQNFNMRCVTSLNCPTSPSMTFGDNSTRSCLSNCTSNNFGDPTSRNCVTQCPKIIVTGTQHYYGDVSTGINLCVTVCPSTPILFGENSTNLCVAQCPQPYYGDQTGKRSCMVQCPIVSGVYYYAQNVSRICVKVCIAGTWGLQSSRQCVENPFHCGAQWADSTTNMCVTTCPATSGLFGDITTGYCVTNCPAGYYADDKTRTCVQRCPENNGPHGTFGNNSTRICQEVCSQPNAYADPQTVNRYCVSQCSQSPAESFADPSTKTCVSKCPVFPSLFAQTQGFTCLSKCITPYFGNTNTRRCGITCPVSQFKLNGSQLCVSICPQNPDLYGDSNSGFCESQCTSNYHRYPTERTCIPSCQSKGYFMYAFTCVNFCPYGFYADTTGVCVSPCPVNTYGQNTTTQCLATCITGYAQGSLCVAKCDDGLFGENKICKLSCTAPSRASNQTNLCVSMCQSGTYLLNGKCELACTVGSYADPSINQCSSSCSNGRYGDPTTNSCVLTCPVGYYRDVTGFCLNDCSPNNRRADNITWNCESICSDGTWGYNFKCYKICPSGYYGYTVDRDCYSIPNIPAVNLFAGNNTQTWVAVCPLSPLRYGDRTKKECVSSCIVGEFADPSSRQCEVSCTNLSYFADTTTSKCVMICPDGFYANTINNRCQNQCTGGKFSYLPIHQCVDTCPAPYYGYNNGNGLLTCTLKCPSGNFAQGRLCLTGCTIGYADPSTNLCVNQCIESFANIGTHNCQVTCAQFGLFADNSSNSCVNQCPSVPDYFEENDVCTPQCSMGLFADPTTGIRSCRTGCTQGLYAEPQSKRCLPSCKPGYYARNLTNTCDPTCLSGQFADSSTGFCELTCPSPTLADPLLNACVKVCSGNQFGENGHCVSTCSSPNFANPLTRTCTPSCPQFDYLFAQNTTHSCVKNCKIVANSFADKNTRKCMLDCSLTLEYALVSEGKCVEKCPQGLFMDNSTKRCESVCTNGYAQPTSRYCVVRCFGAPETYGHMDANGIKTCQYKCLSLTENLYADNRTNLCVSTCTTPMYSDPFSGNCVLFCPESFYAEDTLRTCSNQCNSTQFADNLTRKCVNQCPTLSEQTFGYFGNNTCMRICPNGYFARNDTKQCVISTGCATNSWADPVSKYCVNRCPSDPLSFGYDTDGTCVSTCPLSQDLYGQFINQRCVTACGLRNGNQTYQDPFTRTCVFRCPIQQQFWADTTDSRCKRDCSGLQIRDNSTQMCVLTCPSNPQSYADLNTKYCVRTCPDGTFSSDAVQRICTSDCSLFSLTFGDQTTNRCTPKCPAPYFADNSTYLCVLDCPASEDYYADPHSGTCVLNCPIGISWVSYADPDSRSCVTKCPQGLYAVNSTQRCVPQCPIGQYADEQLNLCVAECTVRPGFYKETNSRVCVSQCPTNIVNTFKYDLTHSCVYFSNGESGCPSPYYGNPLNKMCTTLCPLQYFAQESSRMCVSECATGFVADPTDRRCKTSCAITPEYYANDIAKICVQHCPAPYYQNNQTYRCTLDCSISPLMFRYQQTRQCVLNCHYPYFAYTPTQDCLLACPNGYFAQQSTRSCVTVCNSPYFADDSVNKCVDVCPSVPDYYGYQQVCRFDCPDTWYRDNSTRLCVQQCPIQPLLFADNSTNTCVKYCPADQNFFADNVTRKCVIHCSDGLFAEVQSRTCLNTCPKNLLTYADPTTKVCQPTCPASYYASDVTKECVQLCPDQPKKTYVHINQCLQRCPQNFYGQNTTRTCRPNCLNIDKTFSDDTTNLCVTICPTGLFAENVTQKCVPNCPVGSYADSTTRICVQKCPGTQRLFADPSNQQCVTQCSAGYYGDSLQWICLQNCPDTASGFRLDVGRLCVEECPAPYFAFLPTRNCVQNCGKSMYGDPVTRTCKDCPSQCPTCVSLSNCLTCVATKYLSYGKCVIECILTNEVANYANDETGTCVVATRCPSGMYGLNSTKKCSSTCPSQMYKNATTRRCENCPQYCSACSNFTFCTNCTSDSVLSEQDHSCNPFCNSTHHLYLKQQCVETCPIGTYLDYTAVSCQKCNEICLSCQGNALNCTACFQSFKLDAKCLTQCPQNYYGENAECKLCTTEVQSCANPLTFQVSQTTENFQPVLIVKFNQDTVMKGDPKSFVKVRLSMKSRRLLSQRELQSQADLINDGLYFDAEVLPDGTLKLKLAPGMSLDNAKFEVVFTDASAIQTKSGQSLQSLQTQIELATVQIYPAETLAAASSFEIVGTLLSIAMILPVFALMICSPVAAFQPLEAFQLISLFAYFSDIPPNLFYFLRQLKISRFTFLPSMFAKIYQNPGYFTDKIPVSVAQTQGQLSFSVNAGGFTLIVLIYVLVAGILYIASSKLNSNRPLRNILIDVYNSRVKYGMLNDLLWIFSINIFVSAFLQFRFTDNGGDVAIGTIFMLVFLTGIIFSIYQIYSYQKTPYEQRQLKAEKKSNISFFIEGIKESPFRQHTPSVYYIRKILFTLIIAATINQAFIMAIILVIIQLLMCVYLIALRPYVDNFRNGLHFLNEFGIGFVPCGIIYFIKIKEMKEPIGHKIICGQIITYVVIAHLSIALIWAYARVYFFVKQLYNTFKHTEFYKLYMDEEFENQLEKEIKELNDEEHGDVESVEITNFNDHKTENNEGQQDGDLIIRLKIKRRRIKNKNIPQKQHKQPQIPKRYNKSDYTKLQEQPQEKQTTEITKKTDYYKMELDDSKLQMKRNQENQPIKSQHEMEKNMRKSIHEEEWTVLKFQDTKQVSVQKQKEVADGQFNEKSEQKQQNQFLSDEGYQLEILSNAIISQNQEENRLIKQVSEGMKSEHMDQIDIREENVPLQEEILQNYEKKGEQIFEILQSHGDKPQQVKQASSQQFQQLPLSQPNSQDHFSELKISVDQQQLQKSNDNFSDLNIIVQNQQQEVEQQKVQNNYQDEDFQMLNSQYSHFPSQNHQQNQIIKNNENEQQLISLDKEQNMPNPNIQANNWGELEDLLEEEDEDKDKKAEKRKIHMMIFDKDQLESQQ